jgi:hypothetical protein
LQGPGFTRVMLHHVFHPEFVVQIIASILLQRLKEAVSESEEQIKFKITLHLHMTINSLSKRKKIRMVGIEHIKKTPAIAANIFSADKLSVGRRGTTRSVLQHKFMARQSLAVDAITVGITVGGDQRVWKPQEGRGRGRGGRRTARGRRRSVGQAVERLTVTVGRRMPIKVKYSEPDTRLRQISSDGQLDGREPVIGESVRSGDDGQDIDTGGESANYVDLHLR